MFLHKIHSYAHDCLHSPVGTLQRKRWAFSLAAHNTKTDRWSICLDIGSFTRRHFHVSVLFLPCLQHKYFMQFIHSFFLANGGKAEVTEVGLDYPEY